MENDSRTSQSSLLPAAPAYGVYGSSVHTGAGAGGRADHVSDGHSGYISCYFSPAEELGCSWRLRNDEYHRVPTTEFLHPFSLVVFRAEQCRWYMRAKLLSHV